MKENVCLSFRKFNSKSHLHWFKIEQRVVPLVCQAEEWFVHKVQTASDYWLELRGLCVLHWQFSVPGQMCFVQAPVGIWGSWLSHTITQQLQAMDQLFCSWAYSPLSSHDRNTLPPAAYMKKQMWTWMRILWQWEEIDASPGCDLALTLKQH